MQLIEAILYYITDGEGSQDGSLRFIYFKNLKHYFSDEHLVQLFRVSYTEHPLSLHPTVPRAVETVSRLNKGLSRFL